MSKRVYGQFCGFSRALEVVGERWALLIVRDLLVGPKRFTDLLRGLSGIPTNVLAARLRELEDAGIVARRALPRPESSVVYELTPRGEELEETVFALGRWGAKSLDAPREGEIVTADSLIVAMRSTFQAEAARGEQCAYELHVGPAVIHMRVDDGTLVTGPGPIADADLVIEASPAIKALMSGEMSPAQALGSGAVTVAGDERLLATFANLFRI